MNITYRMSQQLPGFEFQPDQSIEGIIEIHVKETQRMR